MTKADPTMLSSINEVLIFFISLEETRIIALLDQYLFFLQHTMDIFHCH